MIRRKEVTMQDVAKAVGVSVATVSHVINRSATISPQTTKLVMDKIQELGYVIRESAQLNLGNRTIGVLVPDISNEFYATIVEGIFDEARKNSYAVMISNLRHHHSLESAYLRSLVQNNIRGLIICGGTDDDENQILQLRKKVPMVLCDRSLPGKQIDSVQTDNMSVMRRLVRRLAKFGYTRIGYISEDPVMSSSRDRYEGFRQGMAENNLQIETSWVLLRPELRLSKPEEAYSLVTEVLEKQEKLPQVLLCSSDLIAMGVMAALRAHGLKVPRDIGVVGFDDISMAAFTQPPLTSVAQDSYDLGKHSFQLLMDRIGDPKHAAKEVVLQAKIVKRESVKL